MQRLLVYARPELTNRPPGATGGGHHAKRWSASAFLLLEGSWPEDTPPAIYCSLDEAIDGRFDWIDQQAADLAELLGEPDRVCRSQNALPSPRLRGVGPGVRGFAAGPMFRGANRPLDCISPAFLNALALRYYLVKLIRPLAYLTEVQPLRPGDHLALVAAAQRDEDYAELLSQFCRAAGVHSRVQWVESGPHATPGFPANRLWRRCLARLARISHQHPRLDQSADHSVPLLRRSSVGGNHSSLLASRQAVAHCGYLQPPADPRSPGPRVVLCGNPRLLDPVCRELHARGCRLWWLHDRFAVRSWLRWRAAGVRQLTCNASLGQENRLALRVPEQLECRGVNLAGPVRRWLAERAVAYGPRQTRLVEQIDAHFRRVRPDALVLDEDATPLARAAVAVGRRYGAGSLVVQHGVPYCRFGFTPPVADRILVWGQSSRQRLIEWGLPAEQIRVTGSPQHDHLCQELQRLHDRGLLIGRPGRPQCATACREASSADVPRPALLLTKQWHTKEVGRARILLLTTVPPRDDRPDAIALHLTRQTYARMLHTAFAAVAAAEGAELIVKLHPRSGDDPVVRALQAEFRSVRTRLVRRGRLEECLAGVSCVLSCGSSAGVEATLAGVPVIQLAPPGASGFLPHDHWGLAGTARNEAELRELLAQLAADGWRAPPGPDPDVFGGLDRPAAARIADEVLAPRAQSGRTTTHTSRATPAEADRQALPAGYC